MKKDTKKITIAVIFGGRSAEHDVSIVSARNVVRAMDKKKYNSILVGIDRNGNWYFFEENDLLSEGDLFAQNVKERSVIPHTSNGQFFLTVGKDDILIDVVFPILHGPFGEDGTMQGLLKIFSVPFVGPSVLGSAICMDKDVSKRLLHEAGLPVAKFLVFRNYQKKDIIFDKVKKSIGVPFFVKPANLGSSVGISKVKNEKEFAKAVRTAFSYDHKIIIEEYIMGKEVECSVMGNDQLRASIPGEIIPSHEFYSYEAKYVDENGAVMAIPAHLSKTVTKKVQNMAIKTCETLCCEGMGRVDFFVTEKNEIYVNEVNTIPGFTSISMYPKLWEASGVSYVKLIDRLITCAITRHKKENRLKVMR